jgi:hypothetical protein
VDLEERPPTRPRPLDLLPVLAFGATFRGLLRRQEPRGPHRAHELALTPRRRGRRRRVRRGGPRRAPGGEAVVDRPRPPGRGRPRPRRLDRPPVLRRLDGRPATRRRPGRDAARRTCAHGSAGGGAGRRGDGVLGRARSRGERHGVAHPCPGRVVRRPAGRLRHRGRARSPGPPGPGRGRRAAQGGTDLGRLAGNRGTTLDIAVPSGVGAGPGWTVLVSCRAFSVPVANATLAAPAS